MVRFIGWVGWVFWLLKGSCKLGEGGVCWYFLVLLCCFFI